MITFKSVTHFKNYPIIIKACTVSKSNGVLGTDNILSDFVPRSVDLKV